MRKFTKAEKDLCKKIAEKKACVFLIGEGDYYLWGNGQFVKLCTGKLHDEFHEGEFIPLWQEHDCLKWLRKRCKHHVLLIHEEDEAEWWGWFDEYHETQQYDKGKTPLEALLRVVLAVMEEK